MRHATPWIVVDNWFNKVSICHQCTARPVLNCLLKHALLWWGAGGGRVGVSVSVSACTALHKLIFVVLSSELHIFLIE